MQKFIVSLFIFLCVSIVLSGQDRFESHRNLIEVVEFLASDELEGRNTGSRGEAVAARYIASKMKSLGLAARGTDEYFQEFSVITRPNPHDTTVVGDTIYGKNVVGFIDNGARYTVVIGAHYDHLGMGGPGSGSLYTGSTLEIHNGADDNASGVALMLDLAYHLVERKEDYNRYNYLILAFSGEEKGLWGSNYFVKNPTIEIESISYMINFDMVGRLDTLRGLAIYGVGTSPYWEKAIDLANTEHIKLIKTESGVGPSDHTSFYLQDLPVLHFFTGQHEDYHRPSDDADKINYDGMVTIGKMVKSIIASSQEEGKLVFSKTKDDSQSRPTFSVTLGVMPDYMYQGEGMRIDGVTEGRTAHKAGIKKGDVVLQMGDYKINGMQGYMETLGKFEKGQKTTVKINRNGRIIEKLVEF